MVMIDLAYDVVVKLNLFKQNCISVLNEHAPIIVKPVKTIKQPRWLNAKWAKSNCQRSSILQRKTVK